MLAAAVLLAYLAVFIEGEGEDGTVAWISAGVALASCVGAVFLAVRK
jgi:hypothetical protein